MNQVPNYITVIRTFAPFYNEYLASAAKDSSMVVLDIDDTLVVNFDTLNLLKQYTHSMSTKFVSFYNIEDRVVNEHCTKRYGGNYLLTDAHIPTYTQNMMTNETFLLIFSARSPLYAVKTQNLLKDAQIHHSNVQCISAETKKGTFMRRQFPTMVSDLIAQNGTVYVIDDNVLQLESFNEEYRDLVSQGKVKLYLFDTFDLIM